MDNNDKAYRVLSSLNREGYDNSKWGVFDLPEDTSARHLFCHNIDTIVPAGRYFWLWLPTEDDFPSDLEADIVLKMKAGNCASIVKLIKL